MQKLKAADVRRRPVTWMLSQASGPRADECPGEEESAEQTEDQDCR